MLQQDFLSRAQYVASLNRRCPTAGRAAAVDADGRAPYFANYVTDQLVQAFRTKPCTAAGCA